MKASLIITALIFTVGYLADLTVYVKGYYQPTQTLKTKYAYFGGCPSCHLEKRPKSECGESKGWAWDECVLVEYLNPN